MNDIVPRGLPRPTIGLEDVGYVGERQTHLPLNEKARTIGQTIPMHRTELYRRESSNDQVRNLVPPRIDDPSILLPASFAAAFASMADKVAEIAGPDHGVTKIVGELASPMQRLDEKRRETLLG